MPPATVVEQSQLHSVLLPLQLITATHLTEGVALHALHSSCRLTGCGAWLSLRVSVSPSMCTRDRPTDSCSTHINKCSNFDMVLRDCWLVCKRAWLRNVCCCCRVQAGSWYHVLDRHTCKEHCSPPDAP